MGHPENKLPNLVGLVKSWIHRRSDPPNVSRDFWMPDQSCRVCYDCDSQFTFINRRHHCRCCGRVFCSKCTANYVPAPSIASTIAREDCEKIRVCNYCFKQWEECQPAMHDGSHGTSPAISSSPSSISLVSFNSSCTCHSITSNISSTHCSTGPRHRDPYGSGPIIDGQDNFANGRIRNRGTTLMNSPPSYYGLFRSDDEGEDYDYGIYRSDSESMYISQADDYYGAVKSDDIDHIGVPQGAYLDRDNISINKSPVIFDTELPGVNDNSSEDIDEHYNGYECHFPVYGLQDTDNEPLDYENNGLLWLPPEPEDEEDEKEALLFDDDDDDDYCASGDWGYQLSSFGSGEYSIGDRSIEEQGKNAKNMVEGHFRALVSQLLQAENLPLGDKYSKDGWLDIITYLSWEAATLLKPDTSNSGCMDPGGYVKVKCVASGHRSESVIVKGIICKKNVAHRRMARKIHKPRFFILGGALEYQRVSNHLSSFDTLLQQEFDHLKMAVAKIDIHHPNVLLVEKSVSRYAQEYLLSKNITLVLNIKRSLLERVARCTGAQIIPSIDHAVSLKLGYCDAFHVETFLEEHDCVGQGGKKSTKTLMFFEGCPKPLGCSILLKGASGDELKKVKHVVQYATFAAYHLALEGCFLADEGASVPDLPLKSPITVALPNDPSNIDRSISTIPGFIYPAPLKSPDPEPGMEIWKSKKDAILDRESSAIDDIIVNLDFSEPPLSSFISNATSTSFSSSGQDVSTTYPYKLSLNNASEANRTLDLKESFLSMKAIKEEAGIDDDTVSSNPAEALSQYDRPSHIRSNSLDGNNHSCIDLASLRPESTHDNAVSRSLKEEFPSSPSDHQNILVSLSRRCVWKGTVCERAHLLRIKYYGSFDKPLGRFLRDHLFDQNYQCHSCGMPSEAHVYSYAHQQGSLTIVAKKLPEFLLPGEDEGKIWMWHRCLKCPRMNGFPPASRRVLMSDAAWGLSFGKFLELSFSNHAAASRVAGCGHFLHRDCLRFYGFGRTVACFHYAAVNVHSIQLPPAKVEFHLSDMEWIQKEATQVQNRAEILFTEVFSALPQISKKESGIELQELIQYIQELEEIVKMEKEDFEVHLKEVLSGERRVCQPTFDIFEINKLQMHVLFLSYIWVQRLCFAVILGNGNSLDSLSDDIPKLEETRPISVDTELNLSSSQCELLGGCSRDCLPSELKPEIDCDGGNSSQISQSSEIEKEKHIDLGGQEAELCLSPINSNPHGINTMRLAVSGGEHSIVATLSDTLDAWTGETHLDCVRTSEESGSQTDSAILEPVAGHSELEKFTVNLGVEATHLLHSPLLLKRVDDVGTCTNSTSMPCSIYSSLNAQRPEVSDYNPVFISSFRELEKQGDFRLLFHIGINDTVIPVYDDEPSSIIAFALAMPEYHAQMSEPEKLIDVGDTAGFLPLSDSGNLVSLSSSDDAITDAHKSLSANEDNIVLTSGSQSIQSEELLLYTKYLHARVSFVNASPIGQIKYTIICYFAKQFEALRRQCCSSESDYVRSLSRCKKWGAQGGKSNVFFAKTLDERFIIKQVTKTELESFIQFGPAYFRYMSESTRSGFPTCLAKILGMYQVSSKHLKGGKESKMDVLVMENLLFRRNVIRLYDLKGSSRSRYNSDKSGNNNVLLDQNLIEAMPTSPIFVDNNGKRLLERAVWNDTSFLASIHVMDYSLLVGLDQEKHELVLGIIDFVRQYTWDKHLETWVKISGILGGPKNTAPTVISPNQYKRRFRRAMTTYFLTLPDQWPSSTISPSGSHTDLYDDNLQLQRPDSWDWPHCEDCEEILMDKGKKKAYRSSINCLWRTQNGGWASDEHIRKPC